MRLRKNKKEDSKNAPRPAEKTTKERKLPKMEFRLGRTFQSVLDGSILTREQVINLLPFIFFLVFLTIGLIANTYYAERLIRRIDQGNRELKELQVEYINSREKLMNTSRVSALTRKLESEGLYEATVPPFTISAGEEDN